MPKGTCPFKPGDRVGQWELLDGPLLRQTGSRMRWSWHCRCSCGRERLVWQDLMRYGQTSRCRSCASHLRSADPARRAVLAAQAVNTLRTRLPSLSAEQLEEARALIATEQERRGAA